MKIKDIVKRYNNSYLLADITFLSSFAFLFWKKNQYLFVLLLVVAVTIIVIATIHHGTTVVNKSDKKIKAKDEDGSTVFDVNPGEYKSNIDGIKVNDTVYKLPDGVRVVVGKDGKIRAYSLIGGIFKATLGGVLTSAPDNSWDALFPKPA